MLYSDFWSVIDRRSFRPHLSQPVMIPLSTNRSWELSIADRRAQERAQRRDDILQAARTVFNEVGWRRATVEAVAERAQVSKGTIYLYFESKEAVLAELALQALTGLATELAAARDSCSVLQPEQQLQTMAHAYLEFSQNAPDYFRLLTAYDRGEFEQGVSRERQQHLLEQSEHTLNLVSQVIADGMALGQFTPGDANQVAAVLWAALNGALALYSHPVRRLMMPSTIQDFYQHTLDLFLRAICK